MGLRPPTPPADEGMPLSGLPFDLILHIHKGIFETLEAESFQWIIVGIYVTLVVNNANNIFEDYWMDQRKGKSRRLGTIDLDSGEIFEEGVPVWVKAKIKWHEGFFMTFQDAVLQVSQDREITGEMLRVWLNLLGRMSFENWVAVPQKEISDSLGIDRTRVSRSIKALMEKGLILKGPKMGRTSAYKLNSKYAWKGKIASLSNDRMGQVKDFYEEAKKIQEREQRKT